MTFPLKKILLPWILPLAACTAEPEPPHYLEWIDGRTLSVSRVEGIPAGTTFDRVSVEICGADWQTIALVEAPWIAGESRLTLPVSFSSAVLQQVDRGETGKEMEGHWPSVSSDPQAGVATLREDIAVWSGERRVGRLYLTDWSGSPQATTQGRRFVGFQYADRPFVLNGFTGRDSQFTFSACAFDVGWNAYARVARGERNVLVTTDLPSNTVLHWRFEAWP